MDKPQAWNMTEQDGKYANVTMTHSRTVHKSSVAEKLWCCSVGTPEGETAGVGPMFFFGCGSGWVFIGRSLKWVWRPWLVGIIFS